MHGGAAPDVGCRMPVQVAPEVSGDDSPSRVTFTRNSQREPDKEHTSALEGLTGQRKGLRSALWAVNSFTGKKPTDLEELRERHEYLQMVRKYRLRIYFWSIFDSVLNSWRSFQMRNYMFDPSSLTLVLWDWLLACLAVYSVVYVPLIVVLPEIAWTGSESFEVALDAIFLTVCHIPRAPSTEPARRLESTLPSPPS